MSSSKYKTRTDPELVALCLQGDSEAWETLIIRYRRLIYSIPVRFGFTAADASDVFQAICLKLIEHLHQLKDESKVSSWLITTTTRQCLHIKSLKYRESGGDDDVQEQADPAENLEAIRVLTEQQQTVRQAVERLSGRCRELIDMLYFDQHSRSYEEIGQILGMPIASIGPTRARCLEKLRTILRRLGVK